MKKLIGTIFMLLCTLNITGQTYEDIAAMAIDSVNAGNYAAAEKLLKKAIIDNPNDSRNAMLFSNLGNILWTMNKKEDALAAYTSALNSVPLSVPILLQRGKLYIELGEYQKARTDFGNILDVNPNNKEALFFNGYLLAEDNKYKEAEETYKKLLELNPEYKEANISLVLLYNKEKKFEEAIKLLSSLIGKYPDAPEIILARANTEYEMGHLDLAFADLEQLSEACPQNPEIYLLKGDILKTKKMNKQAIEEYEKALELGADKTPTLEKIKECKKKR